ncbi:hypothetical protein [Spartinivicinus poritis]|uniref:Uncharacterized protein n=1 Tax=Spartinivicinus poritis TaxID=2994640 RepID=A0ABT5UAE8_9GAMM|nr:hypothetical protein [Spartinivicinus sp. A2-2]MDE1463356.1 hypothetical protein [Spartinivicinus sp. A2-2]
MLQLGPNLIQFQTVKELTEHCPAAKEIQQELTNVNQQTGIKWVFANGFWDQAKNKCSVIYHHSDEPANEEYQLTVFAKQAGNSWQVSHQLKQPN